MSCEQTRLYLHPYLDDELGVADAIRFEQHLADCAECRSTREQLLALRKALRGADLRFEPTDALASRVSAAIRQTASPRRTPLRSYQWMAVAASVIVIAGLSVLFVSKNREPQELLAREIVDSHIRSLQANHLVDVPSSDRHTVKPWFQGKVDFSPPVADLAAQGWPLEGGRLDYIEGKPVAALVYERRKHQVNVFLWPAGGHPDEDIRQQSEHGYQIVHWISGGMNYWLTSDVNAAELLDFARLLRNQP
jgi:anti-sigma factor RsiW